MPRLTDAQYAALLRAQGRPAKQRTTLPAPSEYAEQCAVIEWAHIMAGRYPELRWLAHIPNGELRDKATAGRLRAAGVNAGIPDLLLPVPRGQWHGMFLELKAAHGRLSPAQEAWLEFLRAQHYLALVCRSAEEAIRTLEHYLQLEG